MDKHNLYYGIFFGVLGVLGIYITIIDFSIQGLALTCAEFALTVTNIELYNLKKDAVGEQDA